MPDWQPNYVKMRKILEDYGEIGKNELFDLAKKAGVFDPDSALSGLLHGGFAAQTKDGRIKATSRSLR